MSDKLKSVTESLATLADAPEQLSNQIDKLAATPAAQKLRRMDEGAGRMVSRVKAAVWLVAATIAGALAYTAWAMTSGWVEIILAGIPAAVALFALWCGISNLRTPTTASAILIEEIEDRVKPARWILLGLRKLFGGGKPAES